MDNRDMPSLLSYCHQSQSKHSIDGLNLIAMARISSIVANTVLSCHKFVIGLPLAYAIEARPCKII